VTVAARVIATAMAMAMAMARVTAAGRVTTRVMGIPPSSRRVAPRSGSTLTTTVTVSCQATATSRGPRTDTVAEPRAAA
jgi:hypothetical protein